MGENLTRLALALSVIMLITVVLYQFGNRNGYAVVDPNESNIPAIHIPEQAPDKQ